MGEIFSKLAARWEDRETEDDWVKYRKWRDRLDADSKRRYGLTDKDIDSLEKNVVVPRKSGLDATDAYEDAMSSGDFSRFRKADPITWKTGLGKALAGGALAAAPAAIASRVAQKGARPFLRGASAVAGLGGGAALYKVLRDNERDYQNALAKLKK